MIVPVMTIKEQIKSLATSLGYHACGITTTEPFEQYREALRQHTAHFPDDAELYHSMESRISPRLRAPWANSIIVCIRRYGKYALPESIANHIGRNYLCDRRIAACPDNTLPKRMKEGLKALGLRVRTGGVPSREAAIRAGVAQVGRNSFAYTPGCGSWLNIEAWMVDAALEPDAPSSAPAPCPPGCRACQDACRTKALQEPRVMHMKHCVAYLTYDAPLPVPEALWSKMGPWIYGCDDCQRACPMNKGQWESREPAPWLDTVADKLTPAALASMDEVTYREVIHPLFGYIPETDLARWHANAKRALASRPPCSTEAGASPSR